MDLSLIIVDNCHRKIMEHYTKARLIAAGSRGEVWVGVDKRTNDTVALKFIPKKHKKSVKAFGIEVTALKTLRPYAKHHMLQYIDSYETPNKYVIVTNYARGLDLYFHIEQETSFGLNDWDTIITDVLEALVVIHRLNMAHRDIKVENVLYSTSEVTTLIDFGFTSDEPFREIFIGTAGYMSQRLIEKYMARPPQPPTLLEYQLSDVFGLGVSMFHVIDLTEPYWPKNGNVADFDFHNFGRPMERSPIMTPGKSRRGHTHEQINAIVDKMLTASYTAEELLREWAPEVLAQIITTPPPPPTPLRKSTSLPIITEVD